MIIIDEFLVQIENAIKTKKELIAKLNNRIESLYDRSGAICLTIRNDNKYYYVKRKTKDKLFSEYIGKNLAEDELNVYREINNNLKILRKRKKVEDNKLKVLIETEKKYSKAARYDN